MYQMLTNFALYMLESSWLPAQSLVSSFQYVPSIHWSQVAAELQDAHLFFPGQSDGKTTLMIYQLCYTIMQAYVHMCIVLTTYVNDQGRVLFHTFKRCKSAIFALQCFFCSALPLCRVIYVLQVNKLIMLCHISAVAVICNCPPSHTSHIIE